MMPKNILPCLPALLLCAACQGAAPRSTAATEPPALNATAETDTRGGGNDVALWRHPSDPARSRIFGSAGEAGIEIYALDGSRVGGFSGPDTALLELRDDFLLDGRPVPLLLATSGRDASVLAFVFEPETDALRPVAAAPLRPGIEINGLCLYRSPRTGDDYAFFVSESGFIQQWALYDSGDGRVDGRLIRTFGSGFGSAHCATDDRGGALYVAEETAGIWRIDAEPETDPARIAVDLVAPLGRLGEEVKGLALLRPAAGGAWLIASDAADNRFALYDLDAGTFAGRFAVTDGDAVDGIEEAEGLHADAGLRTAEFPDGLLLATDDDNDDGAANYKLVSWERIARGLGLAPPAPATSTDAAAVVNVRAAAETDPVDDYGDAADDPAIWVHPQDPSASVIIGAQKQRGLYVYDLAGRTLQVVPDGRMNNVDLRRDFPWRGGTIDLVAASDRSNKGISVYAFDGAARRLSDRLAIIRTGMDDPYGMCMYRSRHSGKFYVFINDSGGLMQQWELHDAGGVLAGIKVREFMLDSQPEGCAADDETGVLYVGEEAFGIWRYSAEPDDGAARTLLDNTENGNLVADVEGISIYYGADGGGYIVVSCQGDDMYAVYRRAGNNGFVGHFRITANAARGVDGASETDGLDVTSAQLGPEFPAGLLVVQDGRNVMPPERQNFKLVSWQAVAEALGLE